MTDPILISERIYLRLVTPDDFERSMQWLNDQEVTRWMQKPYPMTYEKMYAYLTAMKEPNLYLAICLKVKGVTRMTHKGVVEYDIHIGNISLRDNSADKYYSEISIMIGDKQQWGKGYAVEAIKLLTDYCFRVRNIHKVMAGAVSCNYACIKAFESAGYLQETLELDSVFADGEYRNVVRLSKFKKGATK
jgi:ribosomal-protein-alanine N-acetyltransferase